MSFAAGEPVIYAKLEARRIIDVAARVVRAQEVCGRTMFVISVPGGRNRLVASTSLRKPGT